MRGRGRLPLGPVRTMAAIAHFVSNRFKPVYQTSAFGPHTISMRPLFPKLPGSPLSPNRSQKMIDQAADARVLSRKVCVVVRLRETRCGLDQVSMSDDNLLSRRYDQKISFRLYSEHVNGKSFSDLALLYSRSEQWIRERVDWMQLCLEQQVSLENLAPPLCAESIWVGQVWD
jgi:hypothetical protein